MLMLGQYSGPLQSSGGLVQSGWLQACPGLEVSKLISASWNHYQFGSGVVAKFSDSSNCFPSI